MSAPERLNVLLSRARNGLILIGNSATFKNPRKGGDVWRQFFRLLETGKYIFDGLPVRCERHPSMKSMLRDPNDFDLLVPEGGCLEPWYVILPNLCASN